ncbi:uncharacterized protein LOC111696921 isoform X2 [Eurytemora carolleeae]|uniref:uncharacterized protein LOC111696921 isoform X2 n=1 Tax=Eurytemora carolleeae TaxID=1294199 RepID=UPI000C75B107|nr:uncharacterized protein LOC111696921 isoform X2 [Eurytemora carolleeae]|eukprot:XP_023322479.1 uncharacterized protein LOC111696921 isoform X2 [Eurytemora affinis]
MSPKKPVSSLFNLSLKVVESRLSVYLETRTRDLDLAQDSRVEEEIQNLKKLCQNDIDEVFQGPLRFDLLQFYLQGSNIATKTRIGAFILLSSPGIQSLSFGHFTEIWYVCLARVLSTCAPGLIQLSLRWTWFCDKSLRIFIKSASQMINLRQLYVPYIATDELLATVGRNCGHLELLDLSGASGLSENCAKSLYRYDVGGEYWRTDLCSSLQYLYIGGPGGDRLEHRCVSQLLVNLPNLVSLGSYPRTAEALENAERSRGGRRNAPLFKLQYIHQLNIQPQTLKTVIRCCPDLRTLFLDTPCSNWFQQNVNNPEENKKENDDFCLRLTRLKTNKVPASDLLSALRTVGEGTLRCLELVNCKGILDLSKISYLAQGLNSLEVYYSEHCVQLGPLNLQHLTKLVLYSTALSGSLGEELLFVCKQLVHVTLQSADTLDTQKLERIFAAGGLQYIQEFGVLQAPD